MVDDTSGFNVVGTPNRRPRKDDNCQIEVELGGGTSTVFLARLAARFEGQVISFEADQCYFTETQELLRKYHCRNCALHHVPYRSYGNFSWFDIVPIRKALQEQPIDVLVVDAPPGGSEPFARRPALEFLRSHLRVDALVILHDTIRDDEREIARIWAKQFRHTAIHNTEKGLTEFQQFTA